MEGKIDKTDVEQVANSEENFNNGREENQKSVVLNCVKKYFL